MRDYYGWSFQDRSFAFALMLSLGWHFFWFFSITIIVNPKKNSSKPRPAIVSLGPVLDDSIFRTLVDTRPEATEAFYRRGSDFESPVDVEVKTMARQDLRGEVVSLPFGQKMKHSIMEIVGGAKIFSHDDFEDELVKKFQPELSSLNEVILKNRTIVSRPKQPLPPPGVDLSIIQKKTMLQFMVAPSGEVFDVKILTSCGDPLADQLWVDYLSAWRFTEKTGLGPNLNDRSQISFSFAEQGKN